MLLHFFLKKLKFKPMKKLKTKTPQTASIQEIQAFNKNLETAVFSQLETCHQKVESLFDSFLKDDKVFADKPH